MSRRRVASPGSTGWSGPQSGAILVIGVGRRDLAEQLDGVPLSGRGRLTWPTCDQGDSRDAS